MGAKKSFIKPPISQKQRESLEKKFLQGFDTETGDDEESDSDQTEEIKIKMIVIRAPASYHKNILKIRKVTGMTMNGICLELLWPAIKQKLKDLGID